MYSLINYALSVNNNNVTLKNELTLLRDVSFERNYFSFNNTVYSSNKGLQL